MCLINVGYDYLPWFCENAIVLSLREYTNNNIDFRFTGLDPDRYFVSNLSNVEILQNAVWTILHM